MAVQHDVAHASIALQRFGLGAKPGALAAVAADPIGALRAELAAPGAGCIPSSDDLITTAEALTLLDEFRTARKAERDKISAEAAKMAAEGMALAPAVTDGMAAPAPAAPLPKPPEQPINRVFRQEAGARLTAAANAPLGFVERLVWFWSNHFAVAVSKGQPVRITAGAFEREAIRPHVLGRFADMLQAVESHPAMLFYLDNRQSIGPGSRAGERRNRGLNENLARETLELHTLGVGAGYTQADVTALANMITGWTVVGPADEDGELGEFRFNPNRHEPGSQTLLGKAYPAGGMEQGMAALADLARHPATAKRASLKLARHFVGDAPPRALAERLAARWRETDGDLRAVASALLDAPEAWAAPASKLRSPQEFVVAALRSTGGKVDVGRVNGALNAMGQPLWNPPGPNGFPDGGADWMTPEGMKARLDLSETMGRLIGGALNPVDWADDLYGGALSLDTRQTIARAETRQQAFALLFMSPEFQRR